MIDTNSFKTQRLLLKPTVEDDAEFILELLNSPKWLKYIGDRNIKSISKAKAYIKQKMLPQLQRLGFSNYTVIRKSDKTKIGVCGLYDREGIKGIDLGFALLPNFENKGYAFEASKELIEIAFKKFELKEIYAITTEENILSQRLLKKLGFKKNGKIHLSNTNQASLYYKISKLSY